MIRLVDLEAPLPHCTAQVVCAEALLPLAITAAFATSGPHNSKHAKWGEPRGQVRRVCLCVLVPLARRASADFSAREVLVSSLFRMAFL